MEQKLIRLGLNKAKQLEAWKPTKPNKRIEITVIDLSHISLHFWLNKKHNKGRRNLPIKWMFLNLTPHGFII